MSESKDNNDNAYAYAAVSLFGNEPMGEQPQWYELTAWREGTLSAERSAQVLSYIANNPDIFQQWLDMIEAEQWVEDEQTLTASEQTLDYSSNTAKQSGTSLLNNVRDWLAPIFNQPIRVYGGAMAAIVMAVLIVPLIKKGEIDLQQQLNASVDSYLLMDAELPAPPVRRVTRSLGGLFDELSISDVERQQFQFGLRRSAQALGSETTAQWSAWMEELPSERVDCGRAIDNELCSTSAGDIYAMGQWTLLNYAACEAGVANTDDSGDQYVQKQTELFDLLRKQPGLTQSTLFSPLLDKLEANTSAALCQRVLQIMTAGE